VTVSSLLQGWLKSYTPEKTIWIGRDGVSLRIDGDSPCKVGPGNRLRLNLNDRNFLLSGEPPEPVFTHDDCLQPRFGEPKESGSEYRRAQSPTRMGPYPISRSYVNFSAWSHLLGKLPNNLFDVGQAFRGHNSDF